LAIRHRDEENRVDILIDDFKIVKGGLGQGEEKEKEAAQTMKIHEIYLTVELIWVPLTTGSQHVTLPMTMCH
jgi:N-acetylglutamate synthase/N-acetylornithine aminotransferase